MEREISIVSSKSNETKTPVNPQPEEREIAVVSGKKAPAKTQVEHDIATINKSPYRLDISDLPSGLNDAQREFLLSLNVKDTDSLRNIGKEERAVFSWASEKLPKLVLDERDYIGELIDQCALLSDLIDKGKMDKALEETRCASFDNFLIAKKTDIYGYRSSMEQLSKRAQIVRAKLLGCIDRIDYHAELAKIAYDIFSQRNIDGFLLRPLMEAHESLLLLKEDVCSLVIQVETAEKMMDTKINNCEFGLDGLLAKLQQINFSQKLEKKDNETKDGFWKRIFST